MANVETSSPIGKSLLLITETQAAAGTRNDTARLEAKGT
jgi:hypothetical protein